MGDEYLDTIPEMESDELIKSSVENLVPILSESEGILENMCDVPFRDNSLSLNILKDQFEDFSDSNDDSTSIDDDSFSIDDIEYVEATPPDFELISLEVVEIVISEVEGIDEDILLTIKDDILSEKLSDFYEFADELAHIISPPKYDCFCFKNEPDSRDFTMDVVEDISPKREPRIHVPNVLPTHPTLQLNLNFILSNESLFAYVVWIFVPFLTHSVAPHYLLSFGNEDIIFDTDISIYHSFMPDVSHRSGTFIKKTMFIKKQKSNRDFIFHLLPLGPMNSGSSQAQVSGNKNKHFVGGTPCLS
nr:hypothetical protein [Tanacetum cinerariifolium]